MALVHLPGSDSLYSEGPRTVIVLFQAKEEPVKSTEGGGGRGKKGRSEGEGTQREERKDAAR